MKKTKKQLFSGYIRQPWSFVVVYCVILILFFAAAIAFSYLAYTENKEQPLTFSEEVFISCEADNNILILVSESEKVFSLINQPSTNDGAIKAFIDKGETLIVYYCSNDKAEPIDYVIKAIDELDGTPVVTASSIEAAETRSAITALAIVWGIFFAFLIFGVVAYKALCNAPEHPILVRLLIRKEFRNF